MKIQEIIELLRILKWPITIIIISIIFKEALNKLLLRLKKINYKEFQAEFSKAINSIEQKYKFFSKDEEQTKTNQLIKLADITPNATIVDAWREVELAALSAALYNKFEIRGRKGRVAGGKAIKELFGRNIINGDDFQLYRRLKELRNKVVHAEEQISVKEAIKYSLLALDFAEKLREIKN